MDTQETYKNQVREILLTEGHITSWEAIQRMGNTRLSATIFELRKEMDIGMEMKTAENGKRYGYYYFIKEK